MIWRLLVHSALWDLQLITIFRVAFLGFEINQAVFWTTQLLNLNTAAWKTILFRSVDRKAKKQKNTALQTFAWYKCNSGCIHICKWHSTESTHVKKTQAKISAVVTWKHISASSSSPSNYRQLCGRILAAPFCILQLKAHFIKQIGSSAKTTFELVLGTGMVWGLLRLVSLSQTTKGQWGLYY